MIIKSNRLRTVYGSQQTRNHICRGEDNLEVRVIQGHESWIDEVFTYAASHGREYAVRHVIIAPEVDASIEQMVGEARRYAVEFGLDFEDAFVVAHHKPRVKEDACEWHLHALFRDFDILTGAASDTRNNFRRQEKLAREAEHRLGHPFVQGAHTRWVIGQLIKEGKMDVAGSLQAAFPDDAPRPKASLDPATIQKLKRQGLSASALRQHVRNAWHDSTSGSDFLVRVAACGVSITVGEREPPSWIVTVNGNFLCSLAGALPGVRILTINQRLGDPTNVREANALQPIHRRADLADPAPDSRAAAAAGKGRDGGDHPGGAGPDDDRLVEADRAGPGDPARAIGDGNRLHHGSSGLRGGAGSFAPQELIALHQHKRAIAEILTIASRVAELPYARVVRALENMERAAHEDQASAKVVASEALIEAKNRLGQLSADREKASQELRERESDLTKLQAHVPSWWERVSGRYTAQVKNVEDARERAKKADENARASQKRQTEWLGLLTKAHERRMAAAAPIAEKAARNLKIVQQARNMLRTDPRLAALGPFAFIAKAAQRADYRWPSYNSSAEKDKPLPYGDDPRMQVNMWNIPLRFG